VQNFLPGRPPYGVDPRPWTELVDARHHHVDRWYGAGQAATGSGSEPAADDAARG
jgi:hypothetical protein